jgi:hypothetical protein
MQSMLKTFFSHRRRLAPRNPSGLPDRRPGIREPEPMPRMRWY